MGVQTDLLVVKDLIAELNDQCKSLDQLVLTASDFDVNIQLKVVRHHLVASRLILNGVYAVLLMDNKAWEATEEFVNRHNKGI